LPDHFQREFRVQELHIEGVNLIANISANTGLGVHSRHIATRLLEKGIRVDGYDVNAQTGRALSPVPEGVCLKDAPSKFNYPINLFLLNPSAMFAVMAGFSGEFLQDQRLNVAIPMWELPVLPMKWRKAFQAIDVIASPSYSLRASYDTQVDGITTLDAPCPITLPPGIAPDRARFGLPETGVLFFSSFETNSDTARKNPYAAFAAFTQAFKDSDDAYLVIRVNNASGQDQALRRLKGLCAPHPRILLLEQELNYPSVLSLYASCDVLVSLHRAEGMGLVLMEAMSLAKPVIATAWSGNMSYMNHSNACLVDYSLVPVKAELPLYSERYLGAPATWAEPDIGHAAAWMRALWENSQLRAEIGSRARLSMDQYQAVAHEAAFIDEIMAIWRQRKMLGIAGKHKANVPVSLLWDAASAVPSSRLATLVVPFRSFLQQHVSWRVKGLLSRQ
jgi:glycosyltransferase involved in cell wall biosynthesis